ncbi:hypothetical protein IZ6_22440 [Terrihabitans soli]|uniref:Cytochrome c domain-containing protein n=1 Tax=Terrihabitans soli TaxID=708113 RepID=A0A6S6QR34_9HYPH|nr:di-heme oxidoredictase family protein [Terrihabitans soli]BCJ91509.1 hypothetical protein IZ6_22440 [Terrihabitans soli]
MKRLFLATAAVLIASGAFAAGGDLSRAIGKALFERAWVPAPSSTLANDGLGPLFNARACSACHVGLDRSPSAKDEKGEFTHQGMVLKLSDAQGAGDPVYGLQLQTSAAPGFVPEGRLVASLAQDLNAGPLAPSTRSGIRSAPALRGLGRLTEVPDEAILAKADPDDKDGDGISGRVNWITDKNGEKRLGRFGLKASGANLIEQSEVAFSLDLGMSSKLLTAREGDCLTDICRNAPHGGTVDDPEIRHDLVAMIADYLSAVPPPAPVSTDPKGARLFASTGCASCHTPSLPVMNGTIAPHTDLLLHDLGAELDGGATEPGVAATEWRTAPLWGLSRALSAKAGLLHDGRAASVADAVALHGGEGAQARSRFGELPPEDQAALLRYVEGL